MRACKLALALIAALCGCAVIAPLARAQQGHVGPDYISSANLDLVDRIKLVGDGVGATIVGKGAGTARSRPASGRQFRLPTAFIGARRLPWRSR
jgi:hypothetical protein